MQDRLYLPLAGGHPADRGLNIARIKYKNMVELGVNSLDCLKILDPKTNSHVYATALASVENTHDDLLRLDANKSARLGSKIGSTVEVSKFEAQRAEDVWISGEVGFENVRRPVGHGTYISAGDMMVKTYGGVLYSLTIEGYLPVEDVVEVTRKTVFHVNEKVALKQK